MNRLIICIILLATSQATLAEKLYRWIEPDGSITFSPTPPPAGVDFTAVNAAASAGKPEQSAKKQPSILATSQHDNSQATVPGNATPALVRPAPAVATQRLSYAPETGAKKKATNRNTVATAAPNESQQHTTVITDDKRRQCEDLSKRVISLERRLRSPLQPQDMDNTVVAMARYQRSYDRHCD